MEKEKQVIPDGSVDINAVLEHMRSAIGSLIQENIVLKLQLESQSKGSDS